MSGPLQKCENCRFLWMRTGVQKGYWEDVTVDGKWNWNAGPKQWVTRQCRRRAPVGGGGPPYWAPVEPDHWCGEWEVYTKEQAEFRDSVRAQLERPRDQPPAQS